jgi:hypothetical protein
MAAARSPPKCRSASGSPRARRMGTGSTVTEEHPKTIISFNKSPDVPFDRSINAYRDCEHEREQLLKI